MSQTKRSKTFFSIIASLYELTDPNKKPEEQYDLAKVGTIKLCFLVPDYTCPKCGNSTWGWA